jgi:penicillin-binding protein 1C
MELKASADADVNRLYWFEGASFLGDSAVADSLHWTPPGSGKFQLRVVDDHGRVAERTVQVTLER